MHDIVFHRTCPAAGGASSVLSRCDLLGAFPMPVIGIIAFVCSFLVLYVLLFACCMQLCALIVTGLMALNRAPLEAVSWSPSSSEPGTIRLR